MNYSVVISEDLQVRLQKHLLRADGQEDLCFAFFRLSNGKGRTTALMTAIELPRDGDRNIHGNVSFNAAYFYRICSEALKRSCGIVFLHSHPSSGWQAMSNDDVKAEEMLAPRVKAMTDLPLVGMTIASDETWSARFWVKTAPKK